VALLAKLVRKKLVVTILAYADDLKHHDKVKRLYGLITAILQTISAQISNTIHVESVYDLIKLYKFKNKIVLIPPGINALFFSKKSYSKRVNTANEANSKPIILYIGRIHRAKGIDVLLKACHLLIKKGVAYRLVVIGSDDGYLASVYKLIKELGLEDNVEILGRVSEKEKIDLIDNAHVIVVPSLSDIVEAYSLVTSEAWSRGKWVVASRVGALKYRVKDGLNGYLVKPGDPVDLASRLAMALKNRYLHPKMVPKDVWSWDKTISVITTIYNKLLVTSKRK